jgi:hypothetical protein
MRFLLSFAAAAVLATSGANAQHFGDVILTLESGRIVTNTLPGPSAARVFLSEMGELAPHFAQDPGFDCIPGTFPTPGAIGFRVRGPVLRWSGAGLTPSDAPPFSIAFSILGPVFTPSCNSVVQGFTININSNGSWHRHLEFTRHAPFEPGVFVLELELFATNPAIADSRPFWFVFNDGADEADHDAAAQWVEQHLVPQRCPADFDRDGQVAVSDIFAFLSAWFAGPDSADGRRADFNGSCSLDVPDIFDFLSAWFAGCP